jgi:hemerythrin-like metal-binding protein
MPLVWSDDYAIDVPQIDEHHRELFRRIGALHEALMAGRPDGEVTRVLDYLSDYTQYHFREEEALMAEHGYALLPQHRAEHERIVRELSSWKTGGAEGRLSLTLQLSHTLAEWLRGHILGSDRAYARTIFGKRRAA